MNVPSTMHTKEANGTKGNVSKIRSQTDISIFHMEILEIVFQIFESTSLRLILSILSITWLLVIIYLQKKKKKYKYLFLTITKITLFSTIGFSFAFCCLWFGLTITWDIHSFDSKQSTLKKIIKNTFKTWGFLNPKQFKKKSILTNWIFFFFFSFDFHFDSFQFRRRLDVDEPIVGPFYRLSPINYLFFILFLLKFD